MILGRGLRRPIGETVDVDSPERLAMVLGVHRGEEAWWSGADCAGSHRRSDLWHSQRVIGIDADYTDKDGQHAVIPDDVKWDLSTAPCSFAHWTRRGLRLVFFLDTPIVDREAYPRAWEEIARRVEAWLPADVNIQVDRACRDLARFFWAPGDGVEIVSGAQGVLALRDLLAARPPTRADLVLRARAWLERAEAAVEGSGGSATAFRAVERVVRGFDLTPEEALTSLSSWNARCVPPWDTSDKARPDSSLRRLIKRARQMGDTPVGELRDASRGAWREERPALLEGERVELLGGAEPWKVAANVAKLLGEQGPRWDRYAEQVVWPEGAPFSGPLSDEQESAVQAWCWERRLKVAIDTVHAGILYAAHQREFDSLTDYARGLPRWDGVERLSGWLSAYLGAEDTPVTRVFGRRWLISAMARAEHPGCVADGVLVLEGREGRGKNYALVILFGARAKTLGTHKPGRPGLADKIAASSWVTEIPEFDGVKLDDAELKAWVTETSCTWRAPYARNERTLVRRAVLVANSNHAQMLPEGENRRFWPVHVEALDAGALERDRDQLLAEARAAFVAGETWLIGYGDPLWGDIDAVRQDRVASNSVREDVTSALERMTWPYTLDVGALCVHLGISVDKRNGKLWRSVTATLRSLGYVRLQRKVQGTRAVVWEWKRSETGNRV